MSLAGGGASLVVCGLLLALALALRGLLARRRDPTIARLDRSRGELRLTAQHRLHLVEVCGRTLVIGTGPAGPPALIDVSPERAGPELAVVREAGGG